ncbi:MAG: hypothetical protein PHN82_04990 [bacterium]|nr:hypothetical protein [bacterium]
MRAQASFFRNIDFDDLLERFFVAAVLAILGIRFFLHLTGYPQLGGRGLHIAHMLWGGLMMLAAIVLLLVTLDRGTRRFAALLGGLGFGTFIDELGKFITSDNDYFFKPTVALIYIIFISLFLAFRALRRYGGFSREEFLVNGIEILKEAAAGRMTADDRERALRFLRLADPSSPITAAAAACLVRLRAAPPEEPGLAARLKASVRALYARLARRPWFARAVTACFVVEAAAGAAMLLAFVAWVRDGRTAALLPSPSATEGMSLAASALSAVFIVLGVVRLRRSRLAAYEMFKKALLVSIFFSRVFAFYEHQFQAFYGLVADILLLLAINYLIAEEKEMPPEPAA